VRGVRDRTYDVTKTHPASDETLPKGRWVPGNDAPRCRCDIDALTLPPGLAESRFKASARADRGRTVERAREPGVAAATDAGAAAAAV
jgi:hypothetical protein